MELLFAERLRKNRLSKNLTQEQLAQAIKISPQSVSKWERGDGYPDITLLPRIANFFKISVDELIGNDETTQEDDINGFVDRYFKIPTSKEGYLEKLELAKEYYEKYPQNYEVMHWLGLAIVKNMDIIDDNIDLLCEIHSKIMSGCTVEHYRRESIHRMCLAAPDDKLEDQIGKSELDWSEAISIGELREERYFLQHRYEEYRRERNANDLLIFMHYLGRNNMMYYGPDTENTFKEPERTAAWEFHKMKLLERFDDTCREENGVPEAWCGCYAEFSLKVAGALIGCGKIDEGFERLEKTFSLYERWNKIPDGKQMNAGCPDVFGDVRVNKVGKGIRSDISFPDGHTVWAPYLWLFWQNKHDIYVALNKWSWFENVKEDPRYIKFLELAKEMAGKE